MTQSWQPRPSQNHHWSTQPAHWHSSAQPTRQYYLGQPQGAIRPYSPTPQHRPTASHSSDALKWLGVVLFGLFTAFVIINLFSPSDSGGDQRAIEQYQNEDYQVPHVDSNPPEIPMPTDHNEVQQWLTDNDIYRVEAARPVRCETEAIDLQSASNSQLQQHLNDYMGCIMRVYGPAIEEAGFIAVRPSVTVYDYPINTACGQVPMNNAVYCAADQQIYYASDLPEIIPPELRSTSYVVESVIAHEFSHAMQARTGILYSQAALMGSIDEADANDISRRTEMQADCWAGMFNQSVAQSLNITAEDQREISELFYSIGDDVLTGRPDYDGGHGSGHNRQDWYLRGVENTTLGACNTYVANDEEVR